MSRERTRREGRNRACGIVLTFDDTGKEPKMEWSLGEIMKLCIGFLSVALGVGGAVALFRLAGVFKRLTSILTDANTQVIPLLTRVEATLDGVNAELSKVDQITGSVVQIVKAAEHTTTALHGAVARPMRRIAGLAAGVSEGVSSFFAGKRKEN
jgi:hypothetical protein